MPSQSITGKELLNGLLVQNSSIKKPITNKKPPSDLLFYKSFLYYKRTKYYRTFKSISKLCMQLYGQTVIFKIQQINLILLKLMLKIIYQKTWLK